MKKIIFFFFGFLILIGVIGSLFLVKYNYSEGERAGNVMKLSKKGVIFKTYEGMLDLGGLQDGDNEGAATTTWEFSVKDQEVVDDIYDLMHKGDRAVLYYNEKIVSFPWWGKTKYFVYKAKAGGSPK